MHEYPPTATKVHGYLAGVIQPKAHRRRGEREDVPGPAPSASTTYPRWSTPLCAECKTHFHFFLIRLERVQTLQDLIAKKPKKARGLSKHRPFLRRGHITRNRDSHRRELHALRILDFTPHSKIPTSCSDVALPMAHIFPNLDTTTT